MLTNVRMPEQNYGDLQAQIAAMNTGERKVHDMVRKFGVEVFRQGVKDLLDLGERQARAVLSRIPDGDYFFADYLDEDAPGGVPVRLALTLKIRGDEAILDFSGSDAQLQSSLNVPTGGAERHILLMVGYTYCLYSIDPTILLNGGITRPARCIIPEGTILNPQFPAAVGMRSMTCGRLQGVTIGAFRRAVPDLLPAGPAGGGAIMNVKTTDNRSGRTIMASIDPITGGAGGWSGGDGADGSGANSSFLKNTPVEINETEVPIKVLRYGLVPDSGGAGRHRGGLAHPARVQGLRAQLRGDGAQPRPHALFVVGQQRRQAGRHLELLAQPGDQRRHRSRQYRRGGPRSRRRDPGDGVAAAAAGDRPGSATPRRCCSTCSRARSRSRAAADDYGVVIRDGAIDETATAARRARLAANAKPGVFAFNDQREAYEREWTDANYAVLTEVLATLPVHWRHYMKKRIFAALEELPAHQRRGDGSEVRRAFELAVAEFPQLSPAQAAE